KGKHHINRRGKGFSRQRQGVDRLIRSPCRVEHVPRQVEIWKRTLKNNRRSIRLLRISREPSNGREFFFAIAAHEPMGGGPVFDALRRREQRRRRGLAGSLFFDPWKEIVDALVKTRGKDVFRRNDVEAREPGQAGEQIVVGGPQATRIGRLVGHRQQNVRKRRRVAA